MTTSSAVKPNNRTILIALAGALVLVVVLLAMMSDRDDPKPGNPSVYSRIESETSCTVLQREFDRADANHRRDLDRGRIDLAEIDTSYMDAADERMREIGCYHR